jgi:hypothetical protein
MTEYVKVYFRSASGIHEVQLPAIEAVQACRRHPHEWSLTPDTFAQPPEGFVFSEGNGHGRVQGASVRAD